MRDGDLEAVLERTEAAVVLYHLEIEDSVISSELKYALRDNSEAVSG